MPKSRNQVRLEAAWPDLCPAGRKLRYAIEIAQDGVERAKGAKKIAEAGEAKQGAENDFQHHLKGCGFCYDRTRETRQRLAARARRMRRIRASRNVDTEPALTPTSTRYRPARVSGPEGDPLVQYALFRLQGKIVHVVGQA